MQAAPPAPAKPIPHRCTVSELPPWMLDILTSADRAHVVEWESAVSQFVQSSNEPTIQFPPLPPHLRQALAYLGQTFGLTFELLSSIHGNTRVASVLHRTEDTCLPDPKLTSLDVPRRAPVPSGWPTRTEQHGPDPRHQKGSNTKVMIMKRGASESAEEQQRRELARLEAAAQHRQGGDRQLEYQRARARIFESESPSQPKPAQHALKPPPNQALGPQARGFGRGSGAAVLRTQDQAQPSAPPPREPPQRWAHSALKGNQTRNLEDLRDPDYDR